MPTPSVDTMSLRLNPFVPLVLLLLAPVLSLRAQWLTQTNDLVPGWNAVFTHVDASEDTIQNLVGNDPMVPIDRIWMWIPAPPNSTVPVDPAVADASGQQWSSWDRSAGGPLVRLTGNSAYLVHVSGAANYNWRIKGRSVPPQYRWTSSGLNLVGFPTPASNPPSFANLLTPVPDLLQSAEIYQYAGGEFGAGNPIRVSDLLGSRVTRGKAFWIRSQADGAQTPYFNRYFGPFTVSLLDSGGVSFGAASSQASVRLHNVTASTLIVTLRLIASESPPAVVGGTAPPLAPVVVRGSLNPATLSYGVRDFSAGFLSWTLAPAGEPGSDAEVVLGLQRSKMTGNAGANFAGILRFVDSDASSAGTLSQIDIPLSAVVPSIAGLWVGSASVTNVQPYLIKNYIKIAEGQSVSNALAALDIHVNADGLDADGIGYTLDRVSRRVVRLKGTEGLGYLVGSTTPSHSTVAAPFPLRLIVHTDGTTSTLLQQVYYGRDAATKTNLVIATSQSALDPGQLGSARRISTIDLPLGVRDVAANPLGAGQVVSFVDNLRWDEPKSNPFIHEYHPDHDNLDADFSGLPQGQESYGVTRTITLTPAQPSGTDFASVAAASGSLRGTYSEAIKFQGATRLGGAKAQTRNVDVSGDFILSRISDIPVLTSK